MSMLRAAVLAFFVLASGSTLAAVTTTVVDVPTRGVTQRFLYLHPDAPVANIVSVPGGDGIYGIQNDGTMTTLTAICGPVSRNRQAFADHGFAVALVDAASDGTTYNFNDVQEVVRYMQARANVPTWLIGGSASTAAIANLAVNLPGASPVGAIFFSPGAVSPSQVALIRRPTQIVFHTDDPAERSAPLFAALTSAPVKERVALSGGNNGGCGFHLFNGLDAEFLAATIGFIDKYNDSFGPGTPSSALAVEFYNAVLDHYFLTHIANEIAILDAGVTTKGWVRTSQSFNVYAAAGSGTSPVCRFYIPPAKGDSHFYGRGSAECNATGLNNPTFVNEDPQFFHVVLPVAGVCPAGTRSVYRVFSNRLDANHRYMVERSIRESMVTNGWLAEGDGPDLVVMCSPL